MNSEKIKTVLEFSTLECIKNIQAFQKLTEYYWRFIMNFIKIITSLTDLLQKNKSFQWTKKQEQVFQEIKEKFKKKSILIHFNYKKSAIINTDASEHIMKACLQQLDN